MSGSWAVSRDGEFYTGDYATKEEAAACAPDEFDVEPGTKVFVGRSVPYVPKLGGYWLAEHVADEACDEVPSECIDGWLVALSGEEEASLGAAMTAALHTWLREHGHWPDFFSVEDAEEVVVPGDV